VVAGVFDKLQQPVVVPSVLHLVAKLVPEMDNAQAKK
jgi:hypothetical protein